MRSQSAMITLMSCSTSRTPQPRSVSDVADQLDELLALELVQAGSGLVQQQVARLVGERAQHAHSLLVAGRQRGGRRTAARECRRVPVSEPGQLARARDGRARRRARPPPCSRSTVRPRNSLVPWNERATPVRARASTTASR